MKLNGQGFVHIQGLNSLYPGMVYLVLRMAGDFRAITVLQHVLGLTAGVLFLAIWSRLADFFREPRLNRVAHETMGLWGAGVYLLSNTPVLLEMQIRSDAICMFFEMVVLWLAVQFFYYRAISLNPRKAVMYGTATAFNGFLLASLKPSFALTALFIVAPVVLLTLTAKNNLSRKIACFSVVVPTVLALTLIEHQLSRNDDTVKTFLPETLFVIHAKIIHAQMAADLKDGKTDVSSREWLRAACDDLGTEIQESHDLYPDRHPVLGFQPDYLRVGSDSLLNRWRRELGDEKFLKFLKYWYWHTVVNRPFAFVGKIARQMAVFYSANCPAFSPNKKLPLGSRAYAASFSTLSDPKSLHLLLAVPAGADFLARTKQLGAANVFIQEDTRVRMWNLWSAQSYLAILLLSVPVAAWFLLRANGSDGLKWPASLVILLYSVSFGNVLGISVIHTIEVWRYTTVLFISALLAQLWAIRWLPEAVLSKVHNTKSSAEATQQTAISKSLGADVTT